MTDSSWIHPNANILGYRFQPHTKAQGSGLTGTQQALSLASHAFSGAIHMDNCVLTPCGAALEFLRTVYWLANLKLNLKPLLNTCGMYISDRLSLTLLYKFEDLNHYNFCIVI